MTAKPLAMTVVVKPRDGIFVALTIEHFMASAGPTPLAAFTGLVESLAGQAHLDQMG